MRCREEREKMEAVAVEHLNSCHDIAAVRRQVEASVVAICRSECESTRRNPRLRVLPLHPGNERLRVI